VTFIGCLLLGFLAPAAQESEDRPGLPRILTYDDPQEDPWTSRPYRLQPVERPREPDLPDPLSVHLALEMRWIQGRTQVRENNSVPTRLDLGENLGFGAAAGLRFTLAQDWESARLFFEVEMFHGAGQSMISQNITYDERTFTGGLPLNVTVDVFFARSGILFKEAFGRIDGGWIAPFFALEYPRASLSVHQPATGESTGEQYHQMIPYPILGIAGGFELNPSLTLEMKAWAGGLPSVPTPFFEGGRLRMSVRTVNVEAEIRWSLSRNVALTMGAGYLNWRGTLDSGEDGNELHLLSPQVSLGLEVRW